MAFVYYSLVRDEQRDELWRDVVEYGAVSLGDGRRRRVERNHIHRRSDQVEGVLLVRAHHVHGREFVQWAQDDDGHGKVLGSQCHRVGAGSGPQSAVGQDAVRADDHLVHAGHERKDRRVWDHCRLDL